MGKKEQRKKDQKIAKNIEIAF